MCDAASPHTHTRARAPFVSRTHSAGTHWHTYAKLMKPNSPRSLITWLSFHPERSLKRMRRDRGRRRERDRRRKRARKSSPGARGRVLIQSVNSSDEWGGSRVGARIKLCDRSLPFLSPRVSSSPRLHHSVGGLTFFLDTKQTHREMQWGNGREWCQRHTHTHTAVNGSGSEKVSVSAATLDYSRSYVGLQSAENYISSAAIWCYWRDIDRWISRSRWSFFLALIYLSGSLSDVVI